MRRLLIRPGAIGDCILALPAMEHVRAEYTEVWAPSAVVPLLNAFDHARSIAATGLDLLGLEGVEPPAALLSALNGFDSIYSWYGANRPELRQATAHLPTSFFRALPPPDNVEHAADFFALQVGCPTPANPRIRVATFPGRQTIVIHPFSGGRSKNWPLDNFRELARLLPLPVEWCAGPEEELAEAVRFANLLDLAGWIGGARLYIGNDSGITHLAAAVGVPVLALFCKTDPAIWSPRGQNVHVLQGSLSVEDVLRYAGVLLP
jgi:heptosyltransferase III